MQTTATCDDKHTISLSDGVFKTVVFRAGDMAFASARVAKPADLSHFDWWQSIVWSGADASKSDTEVEPARRGTQIGLRWLSTVVGDDVVDEVCLFA